MDVSIKEAKNKLPELVRRAEAGEIVTLTRHGKPVAQIGPSAPKKGGINWEALAAYKKAHGITKIVEYIPEDFDDPLPEDFLLKPLPLSDK
ncbi:MAG: type II toxin-antitoxin system Phd/YefM family antitoxin [Hyphomicrobiales bacterium]